MRRFAYSETKFGAFELRHQIRIISDIIAEMDRCIGIPDRLTELKELLNHYQSLVKSGLPDDLKALCDDIAAASDPYTLLAALKPYIDDRAPTQKDDQMIIRTGDTVKTAAQEILSRAQDITLVLDNLRSVFNVGAIFRTSECLGLRELILCGITPTPDHPNMNKTAMNSCVLVKWSYHPSTIGALASLKQQGYRLYALETAIKASSVFNISYDLPLALVLGNEALGIDPRALSIADEVISLPVNGWKNSLNVSIAMAVTTYQIVYGAH